MKVNRQTGLLSPAKYLQSPHCDFRPDHAEIDMIVIHGISLPPGQFGTKQVEQFFLGQLNPTAHPYFQTIANLQVSSHLLIDRKGEIVQFVPFSKRAWHAGQSHFAGRDGCNDFSIGIELEGTDEMPYEIKQYQQLAQMISVLMQTYTAIQRDRIVGHVDIAPGRKTDPGPLFDWEYLYSLF